MSNREAILRLQEKFDINKIYARVLFNKSPLCADMDIFRDFIENKPKPFVKWVGGKRQLLTQFRRLNLYPPDGFDPVHHKYFEPFVGGGAVFFDLLPKHAHLSDMNRELVITYNVIKSDVESLIKALKKYKIDKESFLKVRALDVKKLSDVQIASRFIYLNRTCFNGLYRVNKSGQFNVPYGSFKNPTICDEENLRKVSDALQAATIKHQDYKEILKRARKGDFIYFDPPYHPLTKTASFTSYTSGGFGEKEQIELRDAFVELHKRGCFVMLSNSDAKFINDIYSGIKGVSFHKIDASRMVNADANGRGKIKEVLVTNY